MTRGTLYVLEALLAAPGGLSPTEVIDVSKVPTHTAQRVLLRLVADRHATRSVEGRRTRYQLTGDGVVWARKTVHDYVTLTASQRKAQRKRLRYKAKARREAMV